MLHAFLARLLAKTTLVAAASLFLILGAAQVYAATSLGHTVLSAPVNNLGLVGYWPLDSVGGGETLLTYRGMGIRER